jgi:CHAT domain-containing protein
MIRGTLERQGVTCTTLFDAYATPSQLRASASEADIIHLATHGDFPEEDAINYHRVLLARSSTDRGPLTAAAMRVLELRHVSLFVLSVCDGGLYRFGAGDEPFGLVAATLAAGAQNLVATLWPITDRIGREMMVAMYAVLLNGGPAEALRTAALAVRDRPGTRLRDWASFVATGSGSPFGH